MQNPVLQILLTIIATFRLTKLLNQDYIMNDVRKKVWEKFPPSTSKIGYIFTCDWCMSIWAAGALMLVRRFAPEIYDEILLILTASAITGIVSEKI